MRAPYHGARVDPAILAVNGTHQDIDGTHGVAVAGEATLTAPVSQPRRAVACQARRAGLRRVRLTDVADRNPGLPADQPLMHAAVPFRQLLACRAVGAWPDPG